MSGFDRLVETMDRQLLQVMGEDATINGTSVRVSIHNNLEGRDEESGIYVIDRAIRIRKDDLPEWESGDTLILTDSGKQYKLLKTIEDDEHQVIIAVR